MLNNTQDILNIVKAFGVLGLSVTLVWLIIYLALLTRSVYQVVREIKRVSAMAENLVNKLSERAQVASMSLGLIVDALRGVVGALESSRKTVKSKVKSKK